MEDHAEIAAAHDLVLPPAGYKPVSGDSALFLAANGSWRKAAVIEHDDTTYTIRVTRKQIVKPRDELEFDDPSPMFIAIPLSTANNIGTKVEALKGQEWRTFAKCLKELIGSMPSSVPQETQEKARKLASWLLKQAQKRATE
jgi:hypothetical protein